mmetsp:Transcript_9392/g.6750  ORF Transcript_9392/g.6750 Transcript_9392/m.6750 type:complete len:104 (-) Transcript_9392:151-462(-)
MMETQEIVFYSIDVNWSGSISKEEISKAFKQNENINYTDLQIDDLVSKIDFNKSGDINYSEFLSCTLDKKTHLTDDVIKKLVKNLSVTSKEDESSESEDEITL